MTDYFPAPPSTDTFENELTVPQSPPFNWQASAISQYANSPHLLGMCAALAEAMDQEADLEAFFNMVWNVLTAEGWGLDVWGRIVVINRQLTVGSRFFGFEEGGPDYDPFNVSPFYAGQGTGSTVTLTDDAYRALILAKAATNICGGSIPEINAILQLLFPGRGPCYVVDNGGMSMTYHFGFQPTPLELAIIETSNVLPRPTGVAVSYSVVP